MINKQSLFGLTRIMKTEADFIENDAVNCYEKILTDIAIIACKRMGLENRAAHYISNVFHHFNHHIRIAKGPSGRFFQYHKYYLIYGTGQGTGWSPFIWTVINGIIIRSTRENCATISLFNPDNSFKSTRNIDEFFDNKSLSINRKSISPDSYLMDITKKSAQKHERYLYMTGGKLAIKNFHSGT